MEENIDSEKVNPNSSNNSGSSSTPINTEIPKIQTSKNESIKKNS